MFNSLPFLAAEINKIGIEIILLLQKLPIIVGPQSEMFWTIYMKMADPNLVYFLYTPVLYPFFAKIMKQMMITAAMGEFVSGILKRRETRACTLWLLRVYGWFLCNV
uniref:Uncharacterized protein n=1 Tax=Romanomermis culicivorax TaxID=13658 RepID=A0A915HK06_ROMCU